MIYRIHYTDRDTGKSGSAEHDTTAERLDDKHFIDCHRYRVQFEDVSETTDGENHGRK